MKSLHCLLMALIFLSGCSQTREKKDGKLFIVATTGMIGDAVKRITGDSALVYTLMGPGVDPHLYKPTPRDVDKLAEADIIVYNGLHLEGKMGEILEKISRQKKVIAVSDGIDRSKLLITNPEQVAEGGKIAYDPHIWFDVNLWMDASGYLGKELQQYDSALAPVFQKNTEDFLRELKKLDSWTKTMIGSIPEESRVLITAHDAFNYFGRAYDIEVMGLQGISTVSEPGLKDISSLVDLLVSRKIRSVYMESSVSEKSIQAVLNGSRARGHEVKIGGVLYSDAMGEKGTPEGTYVGMVRHNVNVIVRGLK